ncbi:polyunsaturated fatty acid 5-lipoxygenase-like [Ptychodera flava]|uniref:polyunsaturated fatty acid 5-lipoxygenase-like n=1 Tax=Ptychodera flava TaxID=63121 RepID=UPI003969C23A
MGNLFGTVHYHVYVRTGDLKGSGTDANVYIVLHNESGEKSDVIRLDNVWRNDFERGCTDKFDVRNLPNFGHIAKLEIWRDAFFGDEWYVDYILVEDSSQRYRYPFPIQRWVDVDHLVVSKYDSFLPQLAPNPEERRAELEEKRSVYKFVTTTEGLPPMATSVPRNEDFTVTYKYDINYVKLQGGLSRTMDLFLSRPKKPWKNLEEIKRIYGGALKEPKNVDHWKEEYYFGEQRLAGCNPAQIRLCTEIPDNLGVTDEMMKPLLEDMSLCEVISQKRLFIVNHKILEDIPRTYPEYVICAPIALFFLNKDKNLIPVAIQLYQKLADDNPVFLPSDPYYTWLMVKLFFNGADACVHEANSHLLFCHLVMECFAVCTNRQLSPSHPLYRLLIPHFQFLLPMNHKGIKTLMDPGGWFDKVMVMGRIGAEAIMQRGWETWRFDLQADFWEELKSRGVDDPEVLPDYPYRDDGILTCQAIESYVTKIVDGNYDTQVKLEEDFELREWAKELATPMPKGFGIKGLPNDGEIKTNAELIKVLTNVITTCSIWHASTNFNQYDEYAHPLKYPSILLGAPPKNKDALTEKDVLSHIPSKRTVTQAMLIAKILSSNATLSLGYFDELYQCDPIATEALQEFRRALKDIGDVIEERNKKRRIAYPYLHPLQLPNAISI